MYLFPQADIFQEYTIKEDAVGFQVNLTVLLDCLTIFGGSTVPGVYHNGDLDSNLFFCKIYLANFCLLFSIEVCAPH